tara:strand:- start:1858 stop:2211 length:354 start_codon:yes stop_codon:yes gene_type:complete
MDKFLSNTNYYLYLNFYNYLNCESLINFIKINKESIKKRSYIYRLVFQELKQLYLTKDKIMCDNYILHKEFNIRMVIPDGSYYKYHNLLIIIKKISSNKFLKGYLQQYLKSVKQLIC